MSKRIIFAVVLFFLWTGCTVKPKFLVEAELESEAQQEIKKRQDEWNWENRERLRREKKD